MEKKTEPKTGVKTQRDSLNITVYSPKVFKALKQIKEINGFSWDETLALILKGNTESRWESLNFELTRLSEWVQIAFPERPDLKMALDSFTTLICNPAINSSPERVAMIQGDIISSHERLIKSVKLEKETLEKKGN